MPLDDYFQERADLGLAKADSKLPIGVRDRRGVKLLASFLDPGKVRNRAAGAVIVAGAFVDEMEILPVVANHVPEVIVLDFNLTVLDPLGLNKASGLECLQRGE